MTGAARDCASNRRILHFVLPAYNEEASIGDLLDRIAQVCRASALDFDVLVVDDGSTDATGKIARARASVMPVDVVRNEPNGGLGFTIRRGLRYVAERGGPEDIIVTLDADLTQDPSYVPSMLEALDAVDADVVIASRYRKGAGIEGLSPLRHLMSYGAAAVVSATRPIRGVRDYSCGFRLYRAAVIRWGFTEYGDDFVSENGFACMLEIAERLRGNAVFAEVPFVLHYDAKRKRSAIRIFPTIAAYLRVLRRVASDSRIPASKVRGENDAARPGERKDGRVSPGRRIGPADLALILGSVVLGATGQAFMRGGMASQEPAGIVVTVLAGLAQPFVWLGLASYAVSSALWLVALSRVALSTAYPFGALTYVIVVLVALATGEQVAPLRWLGVGAIVGGIWLIGGGTQVVE